MTPPADFTGAHRRHWEDAELLFASERLGNADHLYGFSAECGLKAVMTALGMQLGPAGKPPREYRKHVRELWPEFEEFASRHRGGRYLNELPTESPFSDWSHHDRDARDGHPGAAAVGRHRRAARRIRRLVQGADMDETL